MKRTLLLLVAVILFACTGLAGCGQESDVTILYVYNWGEYISDGSEGSLDVNAAFEEYYYETYGERVKVNYSTFSSNESMYAKLSSGAANYDVIFPSDYMVERLISEGLLAKLDFSNIPNIKHIDEKFLGENAYYDPTNEYSVPYTYGMVGIIYNTELVDPNEETLGSWALLWNEKYSGYISQFNNSRDAFGTALYYLGYDVNEATEEQWREALDLLKQQKSIVQGYVMDEIYNKMISSSAAIAPYYAGDFLTMYNDNDKLAFYYPKEGTNIFVDAICIPASSKNKLIAERYINFMLSEEIAIANAEYTYYASPNTLVTSSPEYIEFISSVHEDAMDILYSDAAEVKTQFYKNLPPEKLELLNSLWEELKIKSSLGTAIYVSCAVVIVLVAGYLVFHTVRKKKRENYD
ncbi:MAG: ABC transporter substrate-binding protein [Eubacteriales bacterium]